MASFSVTADFAIDGVAAGQNLAAKFKNVGQGIWEYRPATSPAILDRGTLTVSIRDRQGNVTQIDRVFSIGAAKR